MIERPPLLPPLSRVDAAESPSPVARDSDDSQPKKRGSDSGVGRTKGDALAAGGTAAVAAAEVGGGPDDDEAVAAETVIGGDIKGAGGGTDRGTQVTRRPYSTRARRRIERERD